MAQPKGKKTQAASRGKRNRCPDIQLLREHESNSIFTMASSALVETNAYSTSENGIKCANENKTKENLRMQLDEIEMLESMFPSELKVDSNAISEIEKYLNNCSETKPVFLDFTLNLPIEISEVQKTLQMCVTLSPEYPDKIPEIYLRNSDLRRQDSASMNSELKQFIESLERGEPCIYSAISWCQENFSNFYSSEEVINKNNTLSTHKSDQKLIRMWIHSHHIYCKTKRREILYLADRYDISGFCMPGKPGIICIEGFEEDCNQWWATIRGMTWQKIMCKVTEDCQKRRFESFEEVAFQTNGPRGNHSDLGELFRFMESKGLGFIFKELFGFEGNKSGLTETSGS